MVCAVVPPVIASRPTYCRVRVLDTQDLSGHVLGARQSKRASENGLHEARHHERSRWCYDAGLLRRLSTACDAVVCVAVPPVIGSCPIYRWIHVLDTQNLSRHFLTLSQLFQKQTARSTLPRTMATTAGYQTCLDVSPVVALDIYDAATDVINSGSEPKRWERRPCTAEV